MKYDGPNIISHSDIIEDAVPLTGEQKIMLAIGEEDIKAGRTVDQNVLNEQEI